MVVHRPVQGRHILVLGAGHAESLIQLRQIAHLDLKQKVAVTVRGQVQLATQQAPVFDCTCTLQMRHPIIQRLGKAERLGVVFQVDQAVIEIHSGPLGQTSGKL